MNKEHPNATAYRQAAEAFRVGDLRTVELVIDPDVVWHVPGKHRRAGDIRGRDALLVWLRDITSIGFWLREHDVFGNDQHVCALSHMGVRREGFEIETRVVSIFHFKDGRQVERWFFPEDAEVWNRIGDA